MKGTETCNIGISKNQDGDPHERFQPVKWLDDLDSSCWFEDESQKEINHPVFT